MATISQEIERLDFEYSPLSQADSIRLIELRPSRDRAATIDCELIHTTLRKMRAEIIDHYTALSYVWGDQADLATILAGQRRLQVTKNLECALRHLRDKTRILYVWADAICINQNDNAERTFQVGLMGRIYATAHHTVIFLGPCDANVETALKTIWEDWENDQPSDVRGLNVARSISDQYHQELLDRPWFYRVWIFQELVLSTDPRIQVGSISCTWDVFYSLTIQSAARSNVKNERGTEAITTMQSARQYQKDRVSKPKYETKGRRNSSRRTQKEEKAMKKLLELMASRRGYGVSDPRDMIFAHLGLVHRTGLKINYQLATPQVFEEFFRHYIKVCKDLSIIGFVEDTSVRRTDISSWAPNWTHHYHQLMRLSHKNVSPSEYSDLKGSYEIPPKHLDKWNDVKRQMPSFINSPSVMYGLGFFDSKISEISEILKDCEGKNILNTFPDSHGELLISRWLKERWAPWRAQLGPRQQKYYEPSGKVTAFLLDQHPQPIFWDYMKLGVDFSGVESRKRMPPPSWLILSLLILRSGCGPESNARMVDGRRIASIHESSTSHHLALVPASSRCGDYICVLQGSYTPLVVRECSNDTGTELEEQIRRNFPTEKKMSRKQMRIKHVKVIGECLVGHLFRRVVHPPKEVLDDQVHIVAVH